MIKREDLVAFWSNKDKDTGYLSQWYYSPFVDEMGYYYTCCEQYMMFQKAVLFHDVETAKKIMETEDPKKIKALGREVKNFDSAVWDDAKFDIVVKANHKKFTQNEELRERLLGTGDKILVEASPYDKIWGVGLRANDERILDERNWGQNLLGKALMGVRERIRSERKK